MARWDTDELVATVKRRGFVPAADSNFSVDDFLASCSEEMGAVIAAILESSQGGFLHSSEDQTIVAGTKIYRINARALMMALQHAELVYTDGRVQRLDPIERGAVTTTAQATPTHYYFENNHLVLYPTPDSSVAGVTLRMVFTRSPNRLVQPSAAGRITAFNAGTKVLTFADPIPNTFTTSATFDLIRGKPGFDHLQIDKSISAAHIRSVTGLNRGSGLVTVTTSTNHDLVANNEFRLESDTPHPSFPVGDKTVFDVLTPTTFRYSEPGVALAAGVVYTLYGSTITMTDALPTELAIGDYAANAGYSPVAQIPAELHLSLALRGVVAHLKSMEKLEQAKALEAEAMDKEKRALMLLVPRVAQGKKSLVNRRWF